MFFRVTVSLSRQQPRNEFVRVKYCALCCVGDCIGGRCARPFLTCEESDMTDQTKLPPAAGVVAAIEPQTYTVEQLAEQAQCSARHLWRLIDAGKIPGIVRIGRLVRISRRAADAWLAGEGKAR
jgi:excisionase family DNA binding protein